MVFFMIDLHTHSIISDGSLNPIDLISHAHQKGVGVLALTDHDAVGGLDEAEREAQKCGMVFVRGVELNVEWPTGEFHLLGMGLRTVSPALTRVLDSLQQSRAERNRQIIQKMRDDGFDVSYQELTETVGARSQCIGRPHFAAYFVQKRLVKNRQQAFDKFLATGRPYYITRGGCDLAEAIAAIRESGGAPVLAHPLSLYVSWGKMRGVLTELKERGILGIEAYHPGARNADCTRLEALGTELGFAITAGSDFHGEKIRSDRRIGHLRSGDKIPDRFWTEELSPLLESLR